MNLFQLIQLIIIIIIIIIIININRIPMDMMNIMDTKKNLVRKEAVITARNGAAKKESIKLMLDDQFNYYTLFYVIFALTFQANK